MTITLLVNTNSVINKPDRGNQIQLIMARTLSRTIHSLLLEHARAERALLKRSACGRCAGRHTIVHACEKIHVQIYYR